MKKDRIITKNITINADLAKVFRVWTDIEKWNEWTKSITKISYVTGDKFEIGAKAKVLQPKLLPAVWTITQIIENNCFTWQTRALGVTITATHVLEAAPEGTIAKSGLKYEGLLAGVFYNLSFKLVSQYLTMEIEGLKIRGEKP